MDIRYKNEDIDVCAILSAKGDNMAQLLYRHKGCNMAGEVRKSFKIKTIIIKI